MAYNNNVVIFYSFTTQREVQSFSKNECFVYKFPLSFFSYCTFLSPASASTQQQQLQLTASREREKQSSQRFAVGLLLNRDLESSECKSLNLYCHLHTFSSLFDHISTLYTIFTNYYLHFETLYRNYVRFIVTDVLKRSLLSQGNHGAKMELLPSKPSLALS